MAAIVVCGSTSQWLLLFLYSWHQWLEWNQKSTTMRRRMILPRIFHCIMRLEKIILKRCSNCWCRTRWLRIHSMWPVRRPCISQTVPFPQTRNVWAYYVCVFSVSCYVYVSHTILYRSPVHGHKVPILLRRDLQLQMVCDSMNRPRICLSLMSLTSSQCSMTET